MTGNYCRNPDNMPYLWCITGEGSEMKVSECEDPRVVPNPEHVV
jgi:hypothetical protein